MKNILKKIKDFFKRPTTKFLQEQETNNPDFFKDMNSDKSEPFKDALPSVISSMLSAIK